MLSKAEGKWTLICIPWAPVDAKYTQNTKSSPDEETRSRDYTHPHRPHTQPEHFSCSRRVWGTQSGTPRSSTGPWWPGRWWWLWHWLWHEDDEDHLCGAVVKGGVVSPMVLVKTVCSVVLNTPQVVHQLPKKNILGFRHDLAIIWWYICTAKKQFTCI